MAQAILNLISLAVGVAIAAFWVYSLATWDGQGCTGDDCNTCPFPCEKRNGEKTDRKR